MSWIEESPPAESPPAESPPVEEAPPVEESPPEEAPSDKSTPELYQFNKYLKKYLSHPMIWQTYFR